MGQDDNPLHPGWPSWRVASSHPELVDAQIQMVTIMVIIIVTNHYGDQTLQNIIVSVVILVILAMVALVLSLYNI